MGKRRGIWIDHRKAIIVTLVGETPQLQKILSNVEKHVRASGGSRSSTIYGPQDVFAEDRVNRKYMHHLESYYDEVSKVIRDSEAIFIFGPGEAKHELRKHIEKSKQLSKRIVNVETTDKMTDRQVAAKVKKYFNV